MKFKRVRRLQLQDEQEELVPFAGDASFGATRTSARMSVLQLSDF